MGCGGLQRDGDGQQLYTHTRAHTCIHITIKVRSCAYTSGEVTMVENINNPL